MTATSGPHDQPGEVTDLARLGDELLAAAQHAPAGRAARTLVGVHRLRATLIALTAGTALSEHENPGAATLHVLRGHAVLHSDEGELSVRAGTLTQIPDARHGLRAEEDTVVLLTVSLDASPG